MIKVAFVDYIGQIAQWASPGDDNQWPDRSIQDNYFIVHLPEDTDMVEFSELNYWNIQTAEWVRRARRPNIYYYWNGIEWQLDQEKLYANIRDERNSKLFACDWTQLPDTPLNQETKLQWVVYRQALRDIPSNLQGITAPNQVQWPMPPA
jgi:hypothetical protein